MTARLDSKVYFMNRRGATYRCDLCPGGSHPLLSGETKVAVVEHAGPIRHVFDMACLNMHLEDKAEEYRNDHADEEPTEDDVEDYAYRCPAEDCGRHIPKSEVVQAYHAGYTTTFGPNEDKDCHAYCGDEPSAEMAYTHCICYLLPYYHPDCLLDTMTLDPNSQWKCPTCKRLISQLHIRPRSKPRPAQEAVSSTNALDAERVRDDQLRRHSRTVANAAHVSHDECVHPTQTTDHLMLTKGTVPRE